MQAKKILTSQKSFFIHIKKRGKQPISRHNACHYSDKLSILKKNKKNRCILLIFCGIIIERFKKGETEIQVR
jgi:hypothetical protein